MSGPVLYLRILCAFVFALFAQAAMALNINGVEYVGVNEFARMAGMKYKTVVRGKKMRVFSKWQSIAFEVNSRASKINGVYVNLGHPVAVKSGLLYVSKRDVYKNIYPVVFPAILKNARKPTHIVIDAGHGGKDDGAKNSKYNIKEKSINLDVALKLGAILRKMGYKVSYTRTKDVYVDLEMRPIIANRRNADLFISIHSNSTGTKSVSGVETYALTPVWLPSSSSSRLRAGDGVKYPGNNTDNWSQYLSYTIQKSLLERTGADDRGARRARFAVLRTTNMPACLVEIGFLSNNAECLKLATPSYRLKIANAIANGIVRYESAVKNAASRSRR